MTAEQLGNVANSHLDHYLKGQPLSVTIQDKPLLMALRKKKKTFPGGKGEIRGNVKGDYVTAFLGYSGSQRVAYGNPAKIKQFRYPWYELHAGIKVEHTELKEDGIHVVDTTTGASTSNMSGSDVHTITRVFTDKLEDMDEGMARSMNEMCWLDGTQDPLAFPGIQSIITLNPSSGVTGGIDRATNRWWRNRARVGTLAVESGKTAIESITGPLITASAANQTLTKTMRSEIRQLRRYGNRDFLILCGSTFLEKLEVEVFEKGTYTDSGFINNGKNDIGMSKISARGLGTFEYDPTLDDIGYSAYCYVIDTKNGVCMMPMVDEEMVRHTPARPHDQYVLYRGVTWTGALISKRLNGMGVYQVAA